MKAPRLFLIVILVCMVAGGLLLWHERIHGGDGTLRAYMFDVGQGDGLLLVSPSGKQIVLDGGPDLSMLRHLGKELPFFDRTIELLVLSHPHYDHLAAFPEILKRYKVERVLITGTRYDSHAYESFLSLVRRENAQVTLADPAGDIDMGDGLKLDVLWPREGLLGKSGDANNTSVVVRAAFGSGSILFTGDMEVPEEEDVLQSGQDIRADILKVAHHGSKTSSSTGFLLAVDPELALVSVAKVNTYGHPSPSVVERLKHFGIETRMTMEEGTICLRIFKDGLRRDC